MSYEIEYSPSSHLLSVSILTNKAIDVEIQDFLTFQLSRLLFENMQINIG